MEFTCTKENLSRGLTSVAPIAGRNKQLPSLSHVLLKPESGVLTVTCTDLEVGIKATIPGKVEGEDAVTTPARPLMEYVQQLPNAQPIILKSVAKEITVKTEGFSASFPVGSTEDFPLLPKMDGGASASLSAPLFCQTLSRAIYSAARDNTRPEINSVYISATANTITAAATDSFRLAEEQVKREEDGEVFSLLLPLLAAQEMVRIFSESDSLKISSHDSHVEVSSDGLYITSRLIDGTYPNYQHIIPQSFSTTGNVDRETLIRALKTLLVFLPSDSRRVELVVQPDKNQLLVKVGEGEAGAGDVQVPFEGEGPEVSLIFNINYLLDGLQHLPTERVLIKFVGEGEPAVFLPEGDDIKYTYVVMPIQNT